jgi:hypothetical protein
VSQVVVGRGELSSRTAWTVPLIGWSDGRGGSSIDEAIGIVLNAKQRIDIEVPGSQLVPRPEPCLTLPIRI